MSKDFVIFYNRFEDVCLTIPPEQQLDFIKYILNYIKGQPAELKAPDQLRAAGVIANSLEISREKYFSGRGECKARYGNQNAAKNKSHKNATKCNQTQKTLQYAESATKRNSGTDIDKEYININAQSDDCSTYSFEQFWKDYAYKKDKKRAQKIYAKISESDRTIIKSVLPSYIASTPDQTFRKHPATWLRGECWNDEYTTATQKEQSHIYDNPNDF